MILEGIVTTENPDGTVNIAPMGPTVDEAEALGGELARLTLRPFPDSTTCANLRRHGHGVFHVTDDVEMLARAAIGRLDRAPRLIRQPGVEGQILADACRWYAFEVERLDDSGPRVTIEARVVQQGRMRDFVGFHRARHAVLEAAILATRVHILASEEIRHDFERLATIVGKTGGESEHRALEILGTYVREYWSNSGLPQAGRAVRVAAPSRLHFGLLSFGHETLRQFGGVGAMVDAPGMEILVEPSEQFRTSGPLADRIEQFARRTVEHETEWLLPACHVRLTRAPRQHVGLGTGTQLALAVAAGIHAFAGRELPPAPVLAKMLERGRRSAVGMYGFLGGGLIVEAGKRREDVLAPLISHMDLPADWRFVLIVPQAAQGISGEAERRAFETMPPVPAEVTDQLCREVLLGLIPAAQSADIEGFGEALYRYNHAAGECFAAAQGGAFADESTERLVATIRQRGVAGVGQSSWGPTVFALVASVAAANELIEQLRDEPVATNSDFLVAAPNQGGARVAVA